VVYATILFTIAARVEVAAATATAPLRVPRMAEIHANASYRLRNRCRGGKGSKEVKQEGGKGRGGSGE